MQACFSIEKKYIHYPLNVTQFHAKKCSPATMGYAQANNTPDVIQSWKLCLSYSRISELPCSSPCSAQKRYSTACPFHPQDTLQGLPVGCLQKAIFSQDKILQLVCWVFLSPLKETLNTLAESKNMLFLFKYSQFLFI